VEGKPLVDQETQKPREPHETKKAGKHWMVGKITDYNREKKAKGPVREGT